MNIPIFFINLESDLKRRDHIETEFRNFGVHGQRLNAVLWSSLSEHEKKSYYSRDLNSVQYHTDLVNGEKGCYASHLQAWKILIDSDEQYIVVLEDDVCLTREFEPALKALINLDIPWDMIKLIGRDHEKIRSRRHLISGIDVVEYARVPSYTAGYIINRAGAKKLLTSRQPFGRPIDIDLRFWWENDLQILGVYPSVLKLDITSQQTTIINRDTLKSWRGRLRKLKMKFLMTAINKYHKIHRGRIF